MSFCFLKEKSLCLGTSYKTKDVFIRSSYYYYCEKPAWNVESHSLHVKVSDFAPFRGSYLREFELSRSNSANRIIKITQAHNLHVRVLDFIPFNFTIRAYNNANCLLQNLLKRF